MWRKKFLKALETEEGYFNNQDNGGGMTFWDFLRILLEYFNNQKISKELSLNKNCDSSSLSTHFIHSDEETLFIHMRKLYPFT